MDNNPYNEDHTQDGKEPAPEKEKLIEQSSDQATDDERPSFMEDILSSIGISKLGKKRKVKAGMNH